MLECYSSQNLKLCQCRVESVGENPLFLWWRK